MSDANRRPALQAVDGLDAKPCAVCGRPAQDAYRPFCSKRCADVDLNRWLGEHYRIPTEEPAVRDPEDNGGYS